MNRLFVIFALLLTACSADPTVSPDSSAPASATPDASLAAPLASAVVDPAAIDPCALVSGGPSQTIALDEQGQPAIGGTNIVDYEDWINREELPEVLAAVGGRGCIFLLPDGIGSPGPDSFLQLRDEPTTTAEAMEVTSTLFDSGPPPFSSGPIAMSVNGHPSAMGILPFQSAAGRLTTNMALVVSAEPYLFLVMFNVDESILRLSDAASTIWWDTYGKGDLEPGILAVAADVLARLGR